jgi:ketosteroid isomerase-like protein
MPASREKVVYHSIVRKIVKANFERVNQGDYEPLLSGCLPSIRHRFGGNHALGGQRNDLETLRRWFHRLGRVLPNLSLAVTDLWVTGWPGNTTAFVRWEASATLLDGTPYRNRGVHIIAMRWGKVVSIDAHEDSQAVAQGLAIQAAAGLAEALAEPIISGPQSA